MAHKDLIIDGDGHFIIDPVTREITNQSDKNVLMQYDHNSERLTFEVENLVESHKMSECNRVEIHYINIASDKRSQIRSFYTVDDLKVEDDILTFSWLVSKNVTQLAGAVSFVVRFICMDGDTEVYSWSTSKSDVLKIAESIDNSGVIDEDYSDIINQWYSMLVASGTEGVNKVEEAKNNALTEIQTKKTEILGDMGIVQTTGDSESAVMSQKAVSEEIKKLTDEDLTLLATSSAGGTVNFSKTTSGLNCYKLVTGEGDNPVSFQLLSTDGTNHRCTIYPNSTEYILCDMNCRASYCSPSSYLPYEIYLVNNYEVANGNFLKFAKDSLYSVNENIPIAFNQGQWTVKNGTWSFDYLHNRMSTPKIYCSSCKITLKADEDNGYKVAFFTAKGDKKVMDSGWLTGEKTYLIDNCEWFTVVCKRVVDGVDVSVYPYENTGITVNAEYIVRKKANEQDLIEVAKRLGEVESVVGVNEVLFDNPFKLQKYYSHLFIDKIYASSNPIIPCQSVFDIAVASRLGFNIVEGNVQKTATPGKYIVMHGESGKIGGQLTTLDGSSANDVVIADTSFDDLRNNYKYRSQYEKYQTKVSSLEEFLNECKKFGITPFIQYKDAEQLEIVKQICGNDFILYGGNRDVFKGMLYQWNTTASTKEEIFSICEDVGAPFMFAMGYPGNFSDEELTEIVNGVHERNCLIGFAGCYGNPILNKKLLELGFDFSASGWEVDDFENGNLINASADVDFTDFETTGSEANGVLTLNEGDTLTISDLSQCFLAKGSLHITFNGTITLNFGGYINHDFTSDGSADSWFSTYFMNRTPNFTITAKTATTISTINYKASKC